MSEHAATADDTAVEAHMPCDACGSSDALACYIDHTYCHACNKHTWTQPYNGNGNGKEDEYQTAKKLNITKGQFAPLKDRRITRDVCKYFGVTVKAVNKDKDGSYDVVKHYYPYYNTSGNLVAQKVRFCDDKSKMPWEGKPKQAALFGQNKSKPRPSSPDTNIITITEGELDCMAAYQMFGELYNYVSITNGAGGALRDCKKNFEYLDSFDKIYICFDNDKQGREAAKEVAMLFDGKAYIVTLDDGYKDACDYLVRGMEKRFNTVWWNSEPYVPSEIITGKGILDLIDNYKEKECFTLPWTGLQKMTYGYRLGETWAFVSHAKVGKTSVVREIVHHIIHDSERNHKVGTIFLEGQAREHARAFLSLEANIPMHLPDAVYTEKDMQDARASLPIHKLSLYQQDGAIDIDNILGGVRHYIRAMDYEVVVLDNLMSLVSNEHTEQERQLLNTTITRLVKLGEDTNTFVMIVAHLNRQTGLIHGTSLLEKQAHVVVQLDRDLKADTHKERNTTEVSVNYNRFSGDTGHACDLFYEKSTGRMVELDAKEQRIEKEDRHRKKFYTKTKAKKPTTATANNKQRKDEFEYYDEPDID